MALTKDDSVYPEIERSVPRTRVQPNHRFRVCGTGQVTAGKSESPLTSATHATVISSQKRF